MENKLIEISKNNLKVNHKLDVLHVIEFNMAVEFSIVKIIKNIVKHSSLRHGVISSSVVGYSAIRRAAMTNEVKAIHLHSNTSNLSSTIKILKMPIIQTVHGDAKSVLGDRANKIICIHEPCYDKNRKFSDCLIIENTVDIEKRTSPISDCFKSYVSMFRICDYYISEELINLYSIIGIPFKIYGDLGTNPKFCNIIKEKAEDTCVSILKWTGDARQSLLDNSAYVFYQPVPFPDLCYGLSVMEAVALGLPILTMERKQTFQKYIVNNFNGFVVQDKYELMGKAKMLFEDEKLYSDMCVNAYNHSLTIENLMPKYYNDVYLEFM